jgi:hypothetical protein
MGSLVETSRITLGVVEFLDLGVIDSKIVIICFAVNICSRVPAYASVNESYIGVVIGVCCSV